MYIKIGELIQKLRKQKGITQARLAEGIMTRENLARVENGAQAISNSNLELILEKLGLKASQLSSYVLKDSEHEFYSLRDEVKNHLARFEFDSAETALKKIQAMPASKDKIHEQFILTSRVAINFQKDENHAKALETLRTAIKLTIPKFREEMVSSYFLTGNDIIIINKIAAIYEEIGRQNEAITLLKQLADNVRTNYMDEREKTRNLTFVLCSLTGILSTYGQFEEALELCEEAITAGQRNRVYGLLPILMYNAAYCNYNLGFREKVKHMVLQAYYGSLLAGDGGATAYIIDNAKNDFGITFEQE